MGRRTRKHKRLHRIGPSGLVVEVSKLKPVPKRRSQIIAFPPDEDEDDLEIVELNGARTSLASDRLLFMPPFLRAGEIYIRRFTNIQGEMNDRWWEWEKEQALETVDGRSRTTEGFNWRG